MNIIEQIDTTFWEKVHVMDGSDHPDTRRHIWIAGLTLACVICALSWVQLRRQSASSTDDRLSSRFHGERGLNAAYQIMGR